MSRATFALFLALSTVAFAAGVQFEHRTSAKRGALEPASSPVQIGQAGDCPIFHSRGADGSDITILICRPGASPREIAK